MYHVPLDHNLNTDHIKSYLCCRWSSFLQAETSFTPNPYYCTNLKIC